jgi:hypothetical protein
MLGLGLGLNKLRSSGLSSFLKGAMVWGFKSKFKWGNTSTDIWGFANPTDIDPEAQAVYDRIIADGGVSNLTRLNYFVVGLKTIYGTLANVPVCYDAHWIGYKLGSGTGATAGQAAAKLYSLTVAGDAVQATAASQPLLLAHNGASSDNYWWGSGIAGNYVTTPNASANQITGDIEIIAKVSFNDTTSDDYPISKGSISGTGQYLIRKAGDTLRFYYSKGGWQAAIASTTLTLAGYPPKTLFYLKVNRLTSSGNVLFYGSIDGITYNQIGTTISGTSGALDASTESLFIGQSSAATFFGGKIYRATISNSIGGSPVVDFNPATYNASTSQTAWTSSTGEVWTINTGTATTGYKSALVSRTLVQGDGIDDKIVATGVTLINNHTNYCAYKALAQDASGNRVIYSNGTTNFVNSISSINTNNVFLSLSPVLYTSFGTKILNTLGLTTSVFGTNATRAKVNNGTFSSPLTGVYVGGAGISLFGMPTIHLANSSINTMIVSSSDDSLSVNTATYELIKSLNESAF